MGALHPLEIQDNIKFYYVFFTNIKAKKKNNYLRFLVNRIILESLLK